jgi:ATP-dependent RNA helicase DDX24/MAK5
MNHSRPAPLGRSNNTPKGVRLPSGLEWKQIKCTQRHKDPHLYAYLFTTAQGASGPCLVFCNSIAGVRRVGSTLQKLGLPVRLLLAQMPQVSRWLRKTLNDIAMT